MNAIAAMVLSLTSPPDTLPGRFLELRHEGERGSMDYRLYVPASRGERDAAPPLLVMLHGCTQDATDFAAGTRMNGTAEQRGFLVLYPEQSAAANPQRCWRWFEPEHQGRGAGEPATIVELVRDVVREHEVDPERVYVAGISAGGAMSAVLAISYPDVFAAVAVHSGVAAGMAGSAEEALRVLSGGPPAGRAPPPLRVAAPPPPALLIQGAADAVLSPANLDGLATQWAVLTSAGGLPTVREPPDAAGRDRLRSGATIVAETWMIPGLGHAWSGGSPEGTFTAPDGPDATAAVADFLLARSIRR